MKNWRYMLEWLPEVYFICIAIWWANGSYANWDGFINYPAIILLGILIVQFRMKNRRIGSALSWILGLVSVYLIAALWSDFADYSIVDSASIWFLFAGGLLIATNITMSVWMFRKYNNPS